MTAMLETHQLHKTFTRSDGTDIHAVDDVSITIEEGEIFSLLGPNGAGKTTLISMMSGLLAPTSGDATIAGHSITDTPLQAKQCLGVVPQEIALYPKLSARQNLRFFGQMYGMSGAELNERMDEVLDFIDLVDRQHDRVANFSGGMKRRVNIGVGLLHRPQLIYMDEPTVGIDPQSRRRILDTVFRLRDDYGMTVLYTTHYMEEAQELSDRVGIIDHGEIIALGTQGELTQKVGEEDRLVFTLSAVGIDDALLDTIQAEIEGVTDARFKQKNDDDETAPMLVVFAKRGRQAMPHIIRLLNEADVDVTSVEVKEPDLEAVFLHLTGRALRD